MQDEEQGTEEKKMLEMQREHSKTHHVHHQETNPSSSSLLLGSEKAEVTLSWGLPARDREQGVPCSLPKGRSLPSPSNSSHSSSCTSRPQTKVD